MAEVTKLLFACQHVLKTGHLNKKQAEQLKALILAKDAATMKLASLLVNKSYEEEFSTQVIQLLDSPSSSSIVSTSSEPRTVSFAPSVSSSSSSPSSASSSSSSSASSSTSSSSTSSSVEVNNNTNNNNHIDEVEGEEGEPSSLQSSSSFSVSSLKLRRAQLRGDKEAPTLTTTTNLQSPVDNISAASTSSSSSSSTHTQKLLNLTVAPTPTVQNLPDDDEEQADELMKIKRDRQLKRQTMPEPKRGLPDSVVSQLKH